MKTWSSTENVPAAAITFVGNDSSFPILFTTQHGHQGNEDNKFEWAIKSVEVTLTRDWGTSTAMIVLACHVPNNYSAIPKLPNVSKYRGGQYPYLTYEDEIRIFAGYIASPVTPITADMLDLDMFSPSSSKPLAPIFWGFIDKVDFSGSDTGLQIILSCRDRTRVLADTRLVSIRTESKEKDDSADALVNEASSGDRVELAKATINGASNRQANGQPFYSGGGCWRPVKTEENTVFKGYEEIANNQYKHKTANEIAGAIGNPGEWLRKASLQRGGPDPLLYIWLERPPIKKGTIGSNLQVINKTPYQIIDNLAKTDERPMDFFSSHANGNFVLGPRVLDISGLSDGTRNYRTYFFRARPDGAAPPSAAQMILEMRSVSTTLGTYNRFIVVDSSSKGSQSSLSSLIRVAFEAEPPQLFNRTVSPPCRAQVIYDGALSTYGKNPQEQEAGAFLVGFSAAQISARDISGVQIELLGDSTFYPGEAVKVYNSVLHDDATPVIQDLDAYEENKYRAKTEYVPQPNLSTGEKMYGENNSATVLTQELLSGGAAGNPIKPNTDISNLVLPMYKVRTVRHKITAQGQRAFRTTVVAVSDY